MSQIKTPLRGILLGFSLLTAAACSKLEFEAQPVACETPGSSVKYGMNGPLILYPTIDTVVNGKVNVTGSCVSGLPVEIQEASGQLTLADCKQGLFAAEIELSNGDGTKDLMVSQKSGTQGALVVDRLCFMKDTVPPAVNISNGNSGQSSNSTITTISGTCESGLSVVLSGPGLSAPVTTECTNGNFSTTVQLIAGDGLKDIIGTQIDRAGNQGRDAGSMNIDSTPPNVRITSQIPAITNKSTLLISGICETGLPVEIGELRATVAAPATCTNGTFSTTVPLIGADGPVFTRVFQVDLAGNIGFDSKNLLKDTLAPPVKITLPLANAYLNPTSTVFSGTCETGIPVQVSGSAVSTATSISCTSGAWTLTSAVSAGQGVKTLVAAQTDAAGNKGETSQNFVVDTLAPVLAITSPAENSFVGVNLTLTGTCETGLSVQIAGAGVLPPTSTSCNNGAFAALVSVSPLDGAKLVTATQTDAAGNTGSASRSFRRDSLGPVLSITSPVAGIYVPATITLSGACEAGLTVELSGAGLAAAKSVVCAAGGTYSTSLTLSAGDGTKVISAKETDSAGNSSSVSTNYLRDATPPAVAIASPAANTVGLNGLTVGGSCESGLNVTLSGAGMASTITTPCTNASFSVAIMFSAGAGAKPVSASQTDAAGNTGTDSRTFISDLTPPILTITSPAANTYVAATYQLQGACEAGLNVVLDGAGLANGVTAMCAAAGTYSATVTSSAGDGSKIVTAKQTDAVGNTASVSITYLRDTLAPVLTITTPVNGTTAQNGVTLIGTCEAGLAINISGAGLSMPSSVACAATGTYQSNIAFSNGDGPKTITVTETDAAGNSTQATGNFVRDTTPPAVAITSPATNTVGQSGLTVGGTCETGLNVVLSGTGVAANVTVPCAGAMFSGAIVFSNGGGTKNVIATQTDALGNVGSDTRNFLSDLTPPTLTIAAPTANSYVAQSFTVSGVCEVGAPVTLAGAGLAAAVTTTCASGTYSAAVNASAGDGTKAVTAKQTDSAGNTATAQSQFVRDSQPPVLSIVSPANGTIAQNGVTLTGACEAGLTVSFAGAGLATTSSVVCSNNGSYQAGLNFSTGDGAKLITASETDAAGNNTQVSGNFVRDTTSPAVAITSPAANTVAQSGLTVGGVCETGLNVILSGSGVATNLTVPCNNGAFSGAIVFSAGAGVKLVTATQTDALGNTGSNSRSFASDLTPPTLTITSPAANTYVAATYQLQGACEAGLNVVLGGAGLANGVTAMCAAAGTYSATVTSSAGDGSKIVTAKQTDAVGNTASVSITYLRDTVAPVLTITSPANGTAAQTSVTLIGTCEKGLTVSFSGVGVAAPSSAVCAANGTYQASLNLSAGDGAKIISLSETDPAGNTSQINGNFIRDTSGPLVKITSPDANTVAQYGLTVGGVCETGLNVVLSGQGVSSNLTVPCNNGAFSGAIVFSMTGGTKPVTATQTDALGNSGSDTRSFVSDLTPPAITITSPAANTYVGATYTVQGTCEAGLNVVLGGAGLSNEVVTVCASAGTYSASVTSSAGDGSKIVTAKQTDAVGNTASASITYLRDTLAPVLTITSPANGSTFQSGLSLVGTCEKGLAVNFSGPGLAVASAVVCGANGTYQANLNLSAGDGTKVLHLSETDAAGNTRQATGTFNRDTTPPTVAITSPDAGTSAQNGLTIAGVCEAGLNVVLSGAGLANSSSVLCNNAGTFSAAITFSTGAGAKLITATQTDAVGNTGSGSRSFDRDLTAPLVSITSPTANSYLPNGFTVQGACESGWNVVVGGAGLSAESTVPCNNGAYFATVTVSGGDGTKVVTAQQTDDSGNIGKASQNYRRDTTAPVLTITSPVSGSSVTPSVTLAGTCESGLTVQVSGDLNTIASGACTSGAFSIGITFTTALGTKSVQVQQTDAAGNSGKATAQYLRDSDAAQESFIADASFGKIDILFIDDNSASMDPNQASLGAKFSGFATELLNIDWQIGITTTDCSAGTYGICGTLLPLTGANSNILKPTTANYQTVFNNSIRRPETAGCLNTGTCPSGNSEPLLAATTAMTKYNNVNNGFFRNNADLAVVILSDADERQIGGPTYANRPAELVSTFQSIWPSGKKLKVYSIIVQPNDVNCLNTMRAGSGGFSFYGELVEQTVNLTGGLSTSICAPDYSVTLKGIGESVRTLTNSVELSRTPIAGSVVVSFVPNQNITYKVIGNKVVFDSSPSVGTEIKVTYKY